MVTGKREQRKRREEKRREEKSNPRKAHAMKSEVSPNDLATSRYKPASSTLLMSKTLTTQCSIKEQRAPYALYYCLLHCNQ